MLAKETQGGIKGIEPTAQSLGTIDRALSAMGFAHADRQGAPPSNGILRLPNSFVWWTPEPVRLVAHLSLGTPELSDTGSAKSPPDAHAANTKVIAQPEHLAAAMKWLADDVMPFIDDGGGTEWRHHPDIGRSQFVAAVPYQQQPESVRLSLESPDPKVSTRCGHPFPG